MSSTPSEPTATPAEVCTGLLRGLVVSCRPHQWLKNLFVLAPVLFGGKLMDVWAIGQALLAAAAFCLASSSLYLLNDIIDLRADRLHPEKRNRPLASGSLSVRVGWLGFGVLMVAAVITANCLGGAFLIVMALYAVLTIGYSLVLKHWMVIDCLVVAFGFVLRVFRGSLAIDVEPTHWMLACAFLLALFRAFAKRRQEMVILSRAAVGHREVLSKYTPGFLDQAVTVIAGATIVCYALYTVAPETVARFGTSHLQYGTLFVIYGMLRFMALTRDPSNGDDPGRILCRDWPLMIGILGWAVYNIVIIYGPRVLALFGAIAPG